MYIPPERSAKYTAKLTTAREALSRIRSGSRVFLGAGCAEPQHLLDVLVELGGEGGRLNDVEIVHMLTVGTARHVARRFDLSDRAYARAFKLVGGTPEYYNNVGYSYLLRGKLQDARSNFLKAYELAPNDPTVANNLKLLSSSVKNLER